MGIYIKGMDMPKNCGECHFCHTENFKAWCCPTEREDILFDAIPEWCPLTEVSEPHDVGYVQCFTNWCLHWATDELKWKGGDDE